MLLINVFFSFIGNYGIMPTNGGNNLFGNVLKGLLMVAAVDVVYASIH
jgi:hypothetical protein